MATAFGPCGYRLSLTPGRGSGGRRDGSGDGLRTLKWRKQIAMAMGHVNSAHYLFRIPPAVRKRTHAAATAHSDAHGDGGEPPAGTVTFSSSVSTDIPVYESAGAGISSRTPSCFSTLLSFSSQSAQPLSQVSLDEYISDRPRVFRAMFPDQRRSQRLNDEEWRIQMLPIRFLFASTNPVVVMRLTCKSGGDGYPPTVPGHATSVLELRATRWELQGLDGLCVPSHFALGVRGFLYPDRKGSRSRLKGHLELSIGLVLPPLLALVPEDLIKGVAESILNRVVQRMKSQVNGGLLSDYGDFRREKLMGSAFGRNS